MLPTEQRAKDMTHRDYLWCGLNLMLDDEEVLDSLCLGCRHTAETPHCPSCGCETSPKVMGENTNFDMERFERLRQGGAK